LGVSLDGAEVECTWDWVDELTLAPGSNEIAYVAAKDCSLDEEFGWQVLADMVETTGGRWCVVRGTTASVEYDGAHHPKWSPDGTQLAFAARTSDGWRVIVGERWSPACDEVARIEWAPDGKGVWYGMRNRRELAWSWMSLP
jgi:Tol biopolymer transport system component